LSIQPENILLEESKEINQIKMIDFGLAVNLVGKDDLKSGLVADGRVKELRGTLPYMAPEVIQENFGPKADVSQSVLCAIRDISIIFFSRLGMYLIGKLWAVGVVAFQLLSDNYPFESYHPLEVKKMILGCDFSFKKKIWKNVSADAKSFITHLLTVDEETRPSAEEAMNLPWIKKGRELLASGDLNQSELSSAAACFENLKNFQAQRQVTL